MNPITPTVSPAHRCSAVRRFSPVVCAVLFSLARAAEPSAGPAEPKTHTLFMGADFSVEFNKQLHRVHDVDAGSFVITVDGKDVKVPANWGAVKIKVDRSLKLTGTSVTIDHLKAERAYTPGNDPVKKFMAQQGETQAAQDAVAASYAVSARAQVESNASNHASRGSEPGMATAYGDPATMERMANTTAGQSLSSYSHEAAIQGTMQTELAEELFDAIDLEFDIAAESRIVKPYVVVMAQYHAHGGKPGETLNWLYATALDPLDVRTRKVRIRQGGFPPGYELEKYQVHIYDAGQEVATSVAEKQVSLTRKEAFAYLLIDYLGTHKGATLPATPALGKLTPDEKATLSPDQLRQTIYVKVSADGLPLTASADADFATPVNAAMASLVGDVRFYPALENGRTVEGVAQLKFSHLAL
jgi:hypothetical protein